MAITCFGGDGTMTEARWAELFDMAADQVVSGLAVAVATGTRLVSVASGSAVAAGVLAKSDAAGAVTLDANGTTGANRTDYIVLEINWAGAGAAGVVKFVKGSPGGGAIPPALTQTPGTLWQIPLARVLVRPGVGQLLTSDLEDCRPSRRRPIPYNADISVVSFGPTVTRQVARIDVPDPGWRYRLEIMGAVEFDVAAAGKGVVRALVDGEQVSASRAGDLNSSTATLRPVWSGAREGRASVVTLTVESQGASAAMSTQSAFSGLTVVAHPV